MFCAMNPLPSTPASRSRLPSVLGVAAALAMVGLTPAKTQTPAPNSAQLIAAPEAGWPQFRGPRRDGICDERGLLSSWPENGPRLLWTAKNLGRGYSSPVFGGG